MRWGWIVALAAAVGAAGQERLTLREAEDRALKNNPQIETARLAAEATGYAFGAWRAGATRASRVKRAPWRGRATPGLTPLGRPYPCRHGWRRRLRGPRRHRCGRRCSHR